MLIFPLNTQAQYAPAAGQPGTTAVPYDGGQIVGWANGCEIKRGYVNISDTTATANSSKYASYGTEDEATGKADNSVLSLGDGGEAILTFEYPVVNDTGYDFAVFENGFSFSNQFYFLELAFVEVSSDGKNFYRFNAVSLTDTTTQIDNNTGINPENLYNLAGKYERFYGTPFDLQELEGFAGLNTDSITHIKIIDVVGTLDTAYASRDSEGNMINDPWPTAYESCGFDLDAVGVMHNTDPNPQNTNLLKNALPKVNLFPNPFRDYVYIRYDLSMISGNASIMINDITGTKVFEDKLTNENRINLSFLSSGVYIFFIKQDNELLYQTKLLKR